MAVHHSPAPAVKVIADRLIDSEPEFRHLRNVRIEYLFQSEASRSGGKLILGRARKITGFNALLGTPEALEDADTTSEGLEFFLLTVAADTWLLMSSRQREALVFHELMHFNINIDDEGNALLSLRPHDLEAFGAELAKYGAWKQDVVEFMQRVGSDMLSLWAALDLDEEEPFNMLRDGSGYLDAEHARELAGVNEDGEIRVAAATGDPSEPPFD